MQNPYSAPEQVAIEPVHAPLSMRHYVAIALLAVVPTLGSNGSAIAELTGIASPPVISFFLFAFGVVASTVELVLVVRTWIKDSNASRPLMCVALLTCMLTWLMCCGFALLCGIGWFAGWDRQHK